jgi:hypothetical protein
MGVPVHPDDHMLACEHCGAVFLSRPGVPCGIIDHEMECAAAVKVDGSIATHTAMSGATLGATYTVTRDFDPVLGF